MITPAVIRARYNVTAALDTRFLAGTKGSMASALPYDSSDGCGFLQMDVFERDELCGLGSGHKAVQPKGDAAHRFNKKPCNCSSFDNCGESILDVQTLSGVAPGVRSEVQKSQSFFCSERSFFSRVLSYQFELRDDLFFLNRQAYWLFESGNPTDLFKQIFEDEDAELVISHSFGDSEHESFKEDGGWRMDTELQKIGLRGITMSVPVFTCLRVCLLPTNN